MFKSIYYGLHEDIDTQDIFNSVVSKFEILMANIQVNGCSGELIPKDIYWW